MRADIASLVASLLTVHRTLWIEASERYAAHDDVLLDTWDRLDAMHADLTRCLRDHPHDPGSTVTALLLLEHRARYELRQVRRSDANPHAARATCSTTSRCQPELA